MISKKNIPFDLLKVIEEIVQRNLDVIKSNPEDNTYYSFIEVDSNSKNYFKIFIDGTKQIGDYDRKYFVYEWKPGNTSAINSAVSRGMIQNVIEQLEAWIKLIRDFNNTVSIYDDPLVKRYQDEFYNEYKLTDEDADYAPFSFDKQLLLDNYLNEIIDQSEVYRDEINTKLIDSIISDSKNLKQKITLDSKNKSIKSLSLIWAKMRKAGLPMIKFFLNEAGKYGLKQLFDYGMKHISN